jgi:uncharacterized protein involved in exopolysaccharide biosynthesis
MTSGRNDIVFAIIKRRLGVLVVAGFAFFAVSLAICLLLLPQRFTAQVSLSFTQPMPMSALGGMSSLASLGIAQGNKYVGILRSRRFADAVLRKVDLRSLYHLHDADDAIEMLQGALNVVDSPRDNLLYINVTLPGPPRFGPGAGARRALIKQAATRAANAYAYTLLAYVLNSDNDRESVLRREAETQLRMALGAYNDSVRQLIGFVRTAKGDELSDETGAGSLDNTPSGNTPYGSTASPAISSAAKELEALYLQRGDLEGEIQGAIAAINSSSNLTRKQLSTLNTLPSEDPLLMSARAAVDSRRQELNNLRIQLGPDHPDVRLAEKRYQLAVERLKQQTQAIRGGRTSQQVQAQVNLQSLQTRYTTLNRVIAAAEQKAKASLQFSTDLERLKNDVELRLEVLKDTASQSAVLSLQTVSAKNRVNIIDRAIPPRTGSPGILMSGVMSLLGTLAVVGVWVWTRYRAEMLRIDREPVSA